MSGERVLLTLATLAFALGCYALMLRGWRRRQRGQSDLPPPPPVPDDPGPVLLGAVPGVYVGTTSESDWLDRIAVHRLSDRAAGRMRLHSGGLVVERDGVGDLWLPFDAVLDAEPGDALAGKVVGRDGMLLVTWRLGARTLLSGFRADDHSAHRRFADAVRACLPVADRSPAEETP